MEFKKLSGRIWYSAYEKERDRPILGYVRGDNWSLAVDAGHSRAHTLEFYDELKKADLPLPAVTVLTHWHWDHSFGLCAISGRSISNKRTYWYLSEFMKWSLGECAGRVISIDKPIGVEYPDPGRNALIVTTPDSVFSGEMMLDAGNCLIRLLQTEAPHTDDSTLVVVESDGVLFLGDSASGVFPTWEKDSALSHKLADTIEKLDVSICLRSHHDPVSKQEMLDILRSV